MGRGTRQPREKKEGAGAGNWGAKPDRAFKSGKVEEGGDAAAAKAPSADKPKKVEEEKVAEPEVETEEVILGVGLDDFLKTKTAT